MIKTQTKHVKARAHEWCFPLVSSYRFGDGYTIILRLADNKSNPDSCPVCTYMTTSFPSIELKERHENVLQYQLPSHVCCLARVFDVLANNYEELGILDFSVSQTTLDQVRKIFLHRDTATVPFYPEKYISVYEISATQSFPVEFLLSLGFT